MSNVIQIAQWQRNKAQQALALPALECPKCGVSRPAVSVTEDHATVYRCAGPGHRPFVWRIAENGDMLQGPTGNREYAV